jgi:hypothetical protein
MNLKPTTLANTLAIVAFAAFAICMLWAAIDKSSFIYFWEAWFHGFDLGVMSTKNVGSLNTKSVFGAISFTATSWVAGYAVAGIYNKLNKEN